MEFFIPGACLFLVAIIISALVVPNLSPIIIAVLSVLFLTFGVYSHYKMFNSEYRLSTWQDGFKIYAPAIMIFVIILFTMYGIVALFTGIEVPVPDIPEFELPNTNTITNSVMNAYNTASNTVSQTYKNIVNTNTNGNRNNGANNTANNTANNAANKPANNAANNAANNKGNGNNNNKNKNAKPPSLIETI